MEQQGLGQIKANGQKSSMGLDYTTWTITCCLPGSQDSQEVGIRSRAWRRIQGTVVWGTGMLISIDCAKHVCQPSNFTEHLLTTWDLSREEDCLEKWSYKGRSLSRDNMSTQRTHGNSIWWPLYRMNDICTNSNEEAKLGFPNNRQLSIENRN